MIVTAPPSAALVADEGSAIEIDVLALSTVMVSCLSPVWEVLSVEMTFCV